MKCSDLKQLKLDESGKIGYTFKTLGSGFWALKQTDFRKAITKIVLQVDILTSFAKYFIFIVLLLKYLFWCLISFNSYKREKIKQFLPNHFPSLYFSSMYYMSFINPSIYTARNIKDPFYLCIFFSRNTFAVPLKYYGCKKEMTI